jgi:hypothetical protein
MPWAITAIVVLACFILAIIIIRGNGSYNYGYGYRR